MTSTANRNRVQAGVPTGGEFAREQKGDTGDLVVDAEAERDAAVDQIIAAYEADYDQDARTTALIELDGIEATANFKATVYDDKDWGGAYNSFTVKLTNPRTGAKLSTPYKTGLGIKQEPNAQMVMESMLSDASLYEGSSDAESLASEMGMPLDEDSDLRKARKIWNQLEKQTDKLKEFLGDDYNLYVYGER